MGFVSYLLGWVGRMHFGFTNQNFQQYILVSTLLITIFTIYAINFTGLDSNDGCNCISLVSIFHWNSWNFHVNLANRNKKEVNNWLHLFRLVIYVWLPALNINNVLSFKVPSIFQFFLDPNMSGYQLRDSFPFLI